MPWCDALNGTPQMVETGKNSKGFSSTHLLGPIDLNVAMLQISGWIMLKCCLTSVFSRSFSNTERVCIMQTDATPPKPSNRTVLDSIPKGFHANFLGAILVLQGVIAFVCPNVWKTTVQVGWIQPVAAFASKDQCPLIAQEVLMVHGRSMKLVKVWAKMHQDKHAGVWTSLLGFLLDSFFCNHCRRGKHLEACQVSQDSMQ